MLAIAGFASERVLTGIAATLICDEPSASATHVLLWDRAPLASAAAAQIAQKMPIDAVVVVDRPANRLQRLGIVPGDVDAARRDCARAGIPAELVEVLPCTSRLPFGGCQALAEWVQSHPDAQLVVLREAYQTRVLRRQIDRHLSPAERCRVHVQPWWEREVTVERWWRSERSIERVISGWVHLVHPAVKGWSEANDAEWESVRYQFTQK